MTSPVSLAIGPRTVLFHDIPALAERAGVPLGTLPFVARILIEQLLRAGDEANARRLAIRLGAGENAALEMPFRPARILMQDYTAVPLLVDLAAIRDRVAARGGDVERVRPAVPVQVVVDHSVQVDVAGTPSALAENEALELERNRERYTFLKWAERAVPGITVIPPSDGIVHQINLERLASVVTTVDAPGGRLAFPDSVIGTDSHTTMVNGLGVLGWGVGGLEAFSIMLGLAQPIVVPAVVGVRLTGRMPPGIGASDLVLALTHRLREVGVVGAMVEFFGPGLAELLAPDRCTVANMAPEYGAMVAYFPVDAETVRYLGLTGRTVDHLALVEGYCRAQGLWWQPDTEEPRFARVVEVDLSETGRTLAGPSQPDQRVNSADLGASFAAFHTVKDRMPPVGSLRNGDVVIAAITSCTNTSNPRAMVAAGLLAERAVARGLRVPGHVKTSLSPGSRAVTTYLRAAGLLPALESLGFHVVGYGCMTCNGGSGPLAPEVASAIEADELVVCAVTSSNRNFEGRVHAQVRATYLASPALVVALALAGTVVRDLDRDPVAADAHGRPVYLRELWPTDAEVDACIARWVGPAVFRGARETAEWNEVPTADGRLFPWDADSTYVRRPPYLEAPSPWAGDALVGVRALAVLGDSVSTDHISPVGLVPAGSPAGQFLAAQGVPAVAMNTYGSRRGNHEVMARGTFANPRLRNALVPGVEGGETLYLPTGERVSIYAAAERYAALGTPLLVLAGRDYGMGSSRDWAAKGPWLLGVRVVIAESFERIHRSNLCAMGVLPLTFPGRASWRSLGLDGTETFRFDGLAAAIEAGRIRVTAESAVRPAVVFEAQTEITSAGEWGILGRGGMLPHLLSVLG